MGGVLDENMSNEQKRLEKQEELRIVAQIKAIQEKDWYGMVLISIVMALIFIRVLILSQVGTISLPELIINGMMIGVHGILLFLSQSDKLIAYVGGLLVFLITLGLNFLFVDSFFLRTVYISLVIIGSYSLFIYDQAKLKKLKSKLY